MRFRPELLLVSAAAVFGLIFMTTPGEARRAALGSMRIRLDAVEQQCTGLQNEHDGLAAQVAALAARVADLESRLARCQCPGPGPTACATDADCDDANPCTDDRCDGSGRCVHGNNTGPCDDHSLCTSGDTCRDGVCTGVPMDCSDGNPCNGLETCDPATGLCVAGMVPNCDDGNPCTEDRCDPSGGCMHSDDHCSAP